MNLNLLSGMIAGWWAYHMLRLPRNFLSDASTPESENADQDVEQLQAYRDEIKALEKKLEELETEYDSYQEVSAPLEADSRAQDDLKKIKGIGKVLEGKLYKLGITSYEQIAALDKQGIEKLNEKLDGFPGRIERDDWVGQAKRLLDK